MTFLQCKAVLIQTHDINEVLSMQVIFPAFMIFVGKEIVSSLKALEVIQKQQVQRGQSCHSGIGNPHSKNR